jgi:hypothetical protein
VHVRIDDRTDLGEDVVHRPAETGHTGYRRYRNQAGSERVFDQILALRILPETENAVLDARHENLLRSFCYCTDELTIDPILPKTLLTTELSEGMAATATRPAASAYSTRSWPCVSCQKFVQNALMLVPFVFENSIGTVYPDIGTNS